MIRPFLSLVVFLACSPVLAASAADLGVARLASAVTVTASRPGVAGSEPAPAAAPAVAGAASWRGARQPAACVVIGRAPAEDVSRAQNACERARTRFAELFGGPAPGVRVVLWERGGYRTSARDGEAIVFWPTSRALTQRVGEDAAARAYIEDQWRNVLPHEAAHALLAAQFFNDARPEMNGDAPAADYYGTPFPDWLDESVAIWAESPENRRGRMAEFRQLPERMRALRTILAMPHPASDNDAILAMRDGAPVSANDAVLDFYPQSFAVLAFIIENGGPAAVQELARRLLADPTDTKAIVGLRGLPADIDGVLAAWDAWLGS